MEKVMEQNTNEKKMIVDFTQGNVTKLLLTFAAPLFLSNLLQIVYNMVDMIIVGRYCGSIGLSGVAIGGDISNFLTFLAMGFSNAGQVIISQYIGAGEEEKVGKFIGTMFTFLLSCAFVISVVCLILRVPILRLMNTPAESWDATLAYAATCMTGLIFIYGYNIISAVLRGMGDSRHPFIFVSIAAVMNLVLDIIFVAFLDWGTFGAALATVISQTASFLCAAVFLYRNQDRLGFDIDRKCFTRMDREMLMTLVKLGIPMAIKNASVQFSKLFVNSWINSYGVVVSAVAGIANKFNSISNLFSNSVNTAGSSMVGQNIGAQNYKRVPKIMTVTFSVTIMIAVVMAAALLSMPEAIFGIFTQEIDVLAVCMEYLPIGVLVFFGSAFRAPMNTLINGSGNYRVNFAVAILDGIVLRIGLALVLGLVLGMGYLGFWLGDALASFTPFVIGLVYYFTGAWKTRKYVIKK